MYFGCIKIQLLDKKKNVAVKTTITILLSEGQYQFLFILTKILILTVSQLVSYQCYQFICISYNSLIIDDKNWTSSNNLIFFYLQFVFWWFYSCITILVVFMSFGVNNDLYGKMFKKIHDYVYTKCIK